MYISVYVWVHICMNVCIYICIYAGRHVYACTYIHILHACKDTYVLKINLRFTPLNISNMTEKYRAPLGIKPHASHILDEHPNH